MIAAEEQTDFESFVHACGQGLKQLGHAMTGDPQLAEDATQAALIKVFRKWGQIKHPRAYARRAVLTECIDRQRRLGREDLAVDEAIFDTRRGGQDDPVEAWNIREALWRGVLALPPRQRAVLALRYFECLPDDEISTTLGIRMSTVRSTAARALRTLRQTFEEGER